MLLSTIFCYGHSLINEMAKKLKLKSFSKTKKTGEKGELRVNKSPKMMRTSIIYVRRSAVGKYQI
jgi:hypothetical protein